jgi:large repetitive protein
VNGCVSPVANDTVVVSNAPATANAGPNQIICAGNPVAVAGTITGGSTSGIWTTSGTGTFSPVNTSLNALYNPSPADTAAGAVLLTLTTTNTGSCPPSSSSMTVTITDAPTSNAGPDTTICAYKTVQLNGGISIASGGLWSTSGTGTFDPSPNTLTAVYVPSAADIAAGSVTLTLVTTGTGNCVTAQDQRVVTIIPAPVVNAGLDKYVLLGDSYTLQPTVTGPVTSYSWTPNTWLSSTSIANPVTRPLDDITYILTVTGPGGCTSTDSVAIIVLPPPEIPNVFSPNGDGIHDKWVIRELAKYPNCVVQVFTRWGQLIFNNQGYNEPWDGTSKGKAMPAGTYYYVIEPGNGRPRFSGYVVILR